MHFHCEVHIPTNITDPILQAAYIDEVLAPHSEEVSNDGWWDWYQLGGRWSGEHDPDHDPEKDPRNLDPKRNNEPKWPTGWVVADCDIMPLADVPDDLSCYTLVVDGKIFHAKNWSSAEKTFIPGELTGKVKQTLMEMGITDGFLATVDYHC